MTLPGVDEVMQQWDYILLALSVEANVIVEKIVYDTIFFKEICNISTRQIIFLGIHLYAEGNKLNYLGFFIHN